MITIQDALTRLIDPPYPTGEGRTWDKADFDALQWPGGEAPKVSWQDMEAEKAKIEEERKNAVAAQLASDVRRERNAMLFETDPMLIPDYPISDSDLSAVKEYRQALRDVPQQDGFPNDIDWPKKPDL
jgi:hypothetical protein